MRITRRSFLSAATAPLLIPSSILATRILPNNRITMGFIWMGVQNRGLLNVFLPRCQIVAVCDVDTNRRENARRRVNQYYVNHPDEGTIDCKAYVDYEEMLARKDLDAVCIAIPDHWHAIIILAALLAGKDVYCEKPLTHDIAESVAVIREVDVQGRILQTGSMQRSSWEFRTACELAQNGMIGKIKRIECSFGDPNRTCDLPAEAGEPDLDRNRWIGPAPMRPYHSILSPRGVHMFDTEGWILVNRDKFWFIQGDHTIVKFTQWEDGGYWYGQTMLWDPVGFAFTGGTGDSTWLAAGYRDYKRQSNSLTIDS